MEMVSIGFGGSVRVSGIDAISVASTEDLKWYDSYFSDRAAFPGWPMADGAGSVARVEDCLAIAACSERPEDAWKFVRVLLDPDYEKQCYGIPLNRKASEDLIREDKDSIIYRMTEEGEFEEGTMLPKIEAVAPINLVEAACAFERGGIMAHNIVVGINNHGVAFDAERHYAQRRSPPREHAECHSHVVERGVGRPFGHDGGAEIRGFHQ